VTETDTIAALEARLVVLVPKTVVINAAFVASGKGSGPRSFRLTAQDESDQPIAAGVFDGHAN
jgi:hypothetical protein